MYQGKVTDSGNFKVTYKITNINQLYDYLLNNKSIFARHRMYPTAFIYGWPLRLVAKWIDAGWFWAAEKIK